MFLQLLIVSWKCQKMFSVDLAGVSFLKTNQKRKWFFQKLAIVCNSSLSKNTQEEMNNSEDEDH